MDQQLFHLPWFFPKGRAIAHTCANTRTHGHMHTWFRAVDQQTAQVMRSPCPWGSRADPYAAGMGSSVAGRCQMECKGAIPMLLHRVLVILAHLLLHHLNYPMVLRFLLPV